MIDGDKAKNEEAAMSFQKIDLTTESISSSDLDGMFKKLQSLKKPSAINIFKKRVDPQDEEVIDLLDKFITRVDEVKFMQFLLMNHNELEYFYALSFSPFNKNKKLADQCQLLSLKIFS